MQQQFTDNKNKGYIWNLMCNNNIFNGIPEHKASLMKELLDTKVATISLQITPTDQLVNLNKRVISEMVFEMTKLRATTEAPPQIIYNSAELLQQRQSKFDLQLKQKKSEFEKLNNIPVPTKIDFTDKIEDTPIGGEEIDKILAQQISSRERELNSVLETQDKTAATNWLQAQKTTTMTTSSSTTSSTSTTSPAQKPTTAYIPTDFITLKIGENIHLEEKEIIKPTKKVTFNNDNQMIKTSEVYTEETYKDTATYSDDFISLLKRNDTISQAPAPSNDNIFTNEMKAMLSEILRKQDMILNLLQRN